MRNFRNLEVWNEALELATRIYLLTKSFPKEEKYGMCSQIKRAAISIPSNIAEGSSRRTKHDFARFLDLSLGSSFELESQIELAVKIKFIESNKAKPIQNDLQKIQRRINALRTAILK